MGIKSSRAGEHFVQDCAEAEDAGSCVDIFRLRLFRDM